MRNTAEILGVNVDIIDMNKSIDTILDFRNTDSAKTVFTPNAEFIMCARHDREFMDILNSGDLVIPDGIGVVYAAKILHNKNLCRVTGFDTVSNFFKIGNEKDMTFYILAGKEGIAQKAKDNLIKIYPNLKIIGAHNGYFWKDEFEEQKVIKEINDLRPDFLFVGMGSPRQEKWINKNKNVLNIKVAFGIGGCFDIFAGNLKRSPKIFQTLGVEWLYRFILEPSRYKRIFKLFHFGFIVLGKKLFRK